MKHLDDAGLENRELSIEELDAVAGGSVWGWIKHEVGSGLKWVGEQWAKANEAIGSVLGGGGQITITIHRRN